jgi:hypothetical protein
MKYLQGIVAVLVACIGVFFLAYLAGMNLPASTTSKRSVVLKAGMQPVWDLVSDPGQAAAWHPEARSAVARPDVNGNPVWVEIGEASVVYTRVETTPPRRLVVRTFDDLLPVQAEWTIGLSEEGGGTRVTITQRATVEEPLQRVRFAWIDGPTERIDGWLVGLGTHFGQTVSPVDGR